MQHRSRVHTNL